jgi:nitrate reductase NapE component
MLDLVFVVATVAFFAAAFGFTVWLDRLDRKGAP